MLGQVLAADLCQLSISGIDHSVNSVNRSLRPSEREAEDLTRGRGTALYLVSIRSQAAAVAPWG